MFRPYTYYLYHIPTGKKYYGVRLKPKAEPEHDLWGVYFSSSDLVEGLIKEHGKDSFRVEVRKIFNTVQEARRWEDRVLHRLKAPERMDWLNQAYACGPFYSDWTGRKHTEESKRQMGITKKKKKIPSPMKGKKHTEESKEKNRISHLGRRSSDASYELGAAKRRNIPLKEMHKQNIGIGLLGHDVPDDTRNRISKSLSGKKHSEERRKSNSLSKILWWKKRKEFAKITQILVTQNTLEK